MAGELYYQRVLNTKINAMGGYARKWATQFAVGVPDLIWVFGITAAFIEVKLIKLPSPKVKFDRKIGLTPKQKTEITKIANAGGNVWLAVVFAFEDGTPPRVALTQDFDTRADNNLLVRAQLIRDCDDYLRKEALDVWD